MAGKKESPSLEKKLRDHLRNEKLSCSRDKAWVSSKVPIAKASFFSTQINFFWWADLWIRIIVPVLLLQSGSAEYGVPTSWASKFVHGPVLNMYR